MKNIWDRPSAIAHLVLSALLLGACQGDRLSSPSSEAESRTRVLVDGEMRDVGSTRGAASLSGLQVASTLGQLDKLKPLNIRSKARRGMRVESSWLDANHLVEQVVAFDARGLPTKVQVRTPHGVLVVENEFAISGNAASLVRQVVKSGETLLIERTSARIASLNEVPLSGLYAMRRSVGGAVSACMDGLATILLPRKAYASTDGDPCKKESEAAGSAHRKALLGAAAAGAACATTGGLLCGLAVAMELDVIHDAVVAQEELEKCRDDHPEYVPPPPCTAFCHD